MSEIFADPFANSPVPSDHQGHRDHQRDRGDHQSHRGRRPTTTTERVDGPRTERSYFCRSCQLVARGVWVPAGWYLLERATGGSGKHLRLGLYCSLECLAQAQDGLAASERRHADRLGLPADMARQRKRITDIALTLLHSGSTIRQAADTLEVASSTLRHWLREAGVSVGPDGALAGTAAVTAPDAGAASPAKAAPASPVSTLNELAQTGRITTPAWEVRMDGPTHAPAFTVTVSTTMGDRGTLTGVGTGPTKAAAKADAAAALVAQLPGGRAEAVDLSDGD